LCEPLEKTRKLLADFESKGILLTVNDGRLFATPTAGGMTDADRAALKAYKAELLVLVEQLAAGRDAPGAVKRQLPTTPKHVPPALDPVQPLPVVSKVETPPPVPGDRVSVLVESVWYPATVVEVWRPPMYGEPDRTGHVEVRIDGRGYTTLLHPSNVKTGPVDITALSPQAEAVPPVEVLYQCRSLGETVRVVSHLDGLPLPPAKGEPVTYSAPELERMRGLSPDAIRAIHQSKRRFGGEYIGPTEGSEI